MLTPQPHGHSYPNVQGKAVSSRVDVASSTWWSCVFVVQQGPPAAGDGVAWRGGGALAVPPSVEAALGWLGLCTGVAVAGAGWDGVCGAAGGAAARHNEVPLNDSREAAERAFPLC